MPLKDWNLRQTWDSAYRIKASRRFGILTPGTKVWVHYCRAVQMPDARINAPKLAAALGWSPPGPTAVIVGAGYGFTVEALEELGYTNLLGIDVSTFIQGRKGQDEGPELDENIIEAGLDPGSGVGQQLKMTMMAAAGGPGARSRTSRGILNEDGSTGQSRARIRQALNNANLEWAVSEHILESLNDLETQQASLIANGIAPNVAHVITERQIGNHPGYNWKTLEEWKTLLPGDLFVSAGDYHVL